MLRLGMIKHRKNNGIIEKLSDFYRSTYCFICNSLYKFKRYLSKKDSDDWLEFFALVTVFALMVGMLVAAYTITKNS